LSLRSARAAVGALLFGAVAAAGCREPLRDTGPIGSWSRELFAGRRSIVSFWEENGTLGFRAVRFGEDGRAELRCDAGRCLEYSGETPILEFVFRAERRGDDPAIFVDCDGRPLVPGVTPIQYVLRFEVEPGGLALRVERVELNHRALPVPTNRDLYHKVSNDPRGPG
jgi:hypothetical protein